MTDINPARRVEGKVAIITGASKGMGASHARLLAEHGAKVVMTDIADAEGEALAREIGPNALYIHHDVSDGKNWKEVVDRTLAKFGKLDVLVNNAGIYPAPEDIFDEDVYHRVIAINLTGTFLGVKYAVPPMKRNGGGSIINISSTAGLSGHTGPLAYTASKFGVTGLTRGLAVALGKDRIRVNNVHPGGVEVSPRETWPPAMEEHARRAEEVLPLRKMGKPLEISYLVLFLASDESSNSTGASFVSDGGALA